MSNSPFLMNFKQEVPCLDLDDVLDEGTYSEELQMSTLPDGSLAWNALSRKRPTSCWTSAHRIKGGYTKSGKYKSSRMVKGKSDKRAGK